MYLSFAEFITEESGFSATCHGLDTFFHKEEAQNKSHDDAIKIDTDNEWW